MTTTLLRNISALATMDDGGTEISDAAVRISDGWIETVGRTDEVGAQADEIIDLQDHVVLPGFVNTHHHLYQTLTRAVPAAQDVPLFDWLNALYPVWARLDAESVQLSTQLGLAELALSGCTTAFDHQYLFPNGSSIDDQVHAAGPVGIRFHVSRGSMSLGESDGGLPPDSVVEPEDVILADCATAVGAHHDPSPGAMVRIVLAPCSPFSVSTDLMRRSAEMARQLGVHLHTHLAETKDEEAFCVEKFGARPVEYATDVGWSGNDVWFAHAVHVGPDEVAEMGRAGTGVAHCPTSNMRLASGIAPIREYVAAGVRVGIGCDGSASNDSSHLLAEARQALLLSRLSVAPGVGEGEIMPVREALRLATRGGAEVLGRDDIGSIEVGKAADLIAIDLARLDYAGALHDPIGATILCAPVTVDHSWVHGNRVVENGQLVGVELPSLIERHNAASRAIVDGR